MLPNKILLQVKDAGREFLIPMFLLFKSVYRRGKAGRARYRRSNGAREGGLHAAVGGP